MPKLEEISEGNHLIMCRFSLPNVTVQSQDSAWEILAEEGNGIEAAWLYRRRAGKGSV